MQVKNLRKGFFFGEVWEGKAGTVMVVLGLIYSPSLAMVHSSALPSDLREGRTQILGKEKTHYFFNLLHVSFHTFQDRRGGNYLLPMHSESQAEVRGTRVTENINILLEVSWALLGIKRSSRNQKSLNNAHFIQRSKVRLANLPLIVDVA